MPGKQAQLPLHVLFVFIDGIGLGKAQASINPFHQLKLPAFETLGKNQQWTSGITPVQEQNHVFIPIDARLSVDGLPQSGTGQAALFTGVNAPQVAGRHFGPYPHSTSKPIIAYDNIFARVNRLLHEHQGPTAFANAYPEPFFRYAKARNRWTVTTLSCMEAGIPIRTETELLSGNALTADITGRGWQEKLNPAIVPIDEPEAARRLVSISNQHPFTLFEYYLTDKAGHAQNMDQATHIVETLDRFFAGIIHYMDPDRTLLVVTSDHGNLEDLSTKSHTLNHVPFLAYGSGASSFAGISSLLDVTPTILETLRKFNSTSNSIR